MMIKGRERSCAPEISVIAMLRAKAEKDYLAERGEVQAKELLQEGGAVFDWLAQEQEDEDGRSQRVALVER